MAKKRPRTAEKSRNNWSRAKVDRTLAELAVKGPNWPDKS